MLSKLFKLVGLTAVLSVSSVAVAYPIAVIDVDTPVYEGEFGGINFDARSSIETDAGLGNYIESYAWDLDLDGEFGDLSSTNDEFENIPFGLAYADVNYLELLGLAGAGRHEFRLMATNNLGEESDIAVGWFTILEREVTPPVDVPEPA